MEQFVTVIISDGSSTFTRFAFIIEDNLVIELCSSCKFDQEIEAISLENHFSVLRPFKWKAGNVRSDQTGNALLIQPRLGKSHPDPQQLPDFKTKSKNPKVS